MSDFKTRLIQEEKDLKNNEIPIIYGKDVSSIKETIDINTEGH